jgi:hypothetical protein
MAIIFDQNNALKPPILNNISEITTLPTLSNLQIYADSNLSLTAQSNFEIFANGNFAIESQVIDIGGDVSCTFSSQNLIFTSPLKAPILTTAQILGQPSINGSIAFCSTINQMVFYQVSPITGLVLGWYNSTGSIKL